MAAPASAAASPVTAGAAATAAAAPYTKNATLNRKLNKVLDITLDDHMRTSLEAVSGFCVTGAGAEGEEWERERRNLRGMLERRTLALHQTFLADFKRVNDQFARVSAEIDTLCESCAGVKAGLQGTREESQQLVDTLAVLQQELDEARRKEEQVGAFLGRFHLTPEDKQVLRGEVGPPFFQVLEKVKDIHSNCAELLSAQHQQAGIEIMEMTYMQQMQGYDRLHKWALGQVGEVMSQDTPEVPSLLVRGLNTLRDRGALWAQLMQEVARQRRAAVARKFFTALTRGSAQCRALELHAHDPQRYVGDMLAWVHQAVAEEGDLVDSFFAPRGPGGGDAPALDLSKKDVLDQIFEGLVKHLGGRIGQALDAAGGAQQGSLVVFFRLESVLQFYSTAVPAALGPGAALSKLLRDLKLQALKRFFDLLKAMSDQLLAAPVALGTDLAPPGVVGDALKKLREMMDTLAASLIAPADREREFSAVLNGIIDPLLTLVDRVQDLERPAHCILMINSLCRMLSVLEQHEFTKAKVLKLNERLQREASALVDHHSANLLRRCGLAEAVDATRRLTVDASGARAPLASLPTTSEAVMRETIASFYQYLHALGSGVLPGCEKIQAARPREEVSGRIARRVADAYAALHAALTDPRNGYTPNAPWLEHSPQGVRTILGIE